MEELGFTGLSVCLRLLHSEREREREEMMMRESGGCKKWKLHEHV